MNYSQNIGISIVLILSMTQGTACHSKLKKTWISGLIWMKAHTVWGYYGPDY